MRTAESLETSPNLYRVLVAWVMTEHLPWKEKTWYQFVLTWRYSEHLPEMHSVRAQASPKGDA
jgi:hypothetical protein